MTEGGYISRLEIAQRIAEREKVVSQVKWTRNDCLPTAVAFTHGLPADYHKLGLYARAYVHQAIEASSVLSERNGENTILYKFEVKDRVQTLKRIDRKLDWSDKAWIIFGNENNSHVLGIIKLDEDEYMVANISLDNPYSKMTAGEIADHLMSYKKYSDLGVCIIGFKKKK